MRARIAEIAGISLDRVGVKATTNEKLGFDRPRRRHRGLRDRDDPPALERSMIDAETRALAHARARCLPRAQNRWSRPRNPAPAGWSRRALTEIAGSSDVVDRGFVTYSNAAKMALLGVPEATLAAHGAVSRRPRRRWRKGALARAGVDLTVAITGIAGPGGGSAEKPVGLVHFAAAAKDGRLIHREKRYGDIGRSEVRRLSVIEALDMMLELAA